MGRNILDLYSDYLLCSSGQTTATGLSALLQGCSHDRITRFLRKEYFDEKTLWKKVKTFVRANEEEGACLIFDDTINMFDNYQNTLPLAQKTSKEYTFLYTFGVIEHV
jgi:hypothetical protein